MTLLRRHRRNHRARAPKKRKRRNLVKFVPSADSDFAHTAARTFAHYIMPEPAAFGLNDDDAARIAEAVNVFRFTLAKALNKRTRNQEIIDAKNAARKQAEKIVRRYARIIAANPNVSDVKKKMLRLKSPKEKLKPRKCPQSPPVLMFMGTGDGVAYESGTGGGSGVHVLKVWDRDVQGNLRHARPDNAVRLELYFDMVPPGEPVPRHPGERGWRKYLRSFTRSPIEVQFPVPSQPMLVVYWACWANATGEVGRFSKTCVARVEGWTSNAVALPEGAADSARQIAGRAVETKYVFIHTPIAGELPEAEGLAGDDVANELAALGKQMLEAAMPRMLEAG